MLAARPLGMKVTAWIAIIIGSGLVVLFGTALPREVAVVGSLSGITITIMGFLVGVALGIGGVGVLSVKKWGPRLLLSAWFIYLPFMLYFYYGSRGLVMFGGYDPMLIALSVVVLVCAVLPPAWSFYYLLVRSSVKVKEKFR